MTDALEGSIGQLDGTPDPEFVGKPCAYCGEPSEGYYSIHRDGFDMGPEVALCNEHGGKPTPTCEEIWDAISNDGKQTFKEAKVLVGDTMIPVTDLKIGNRTPTREQLTRAWGCDACGVQRHMRVDAPVSVKLSGPAWPGVWQLIDLCLCETCMNQRQMRQTALAVIQAALQMNKPVKAKLVRTDEEGTAVLYQGVETFLGRNDKGTAVQKKAMPKFNAATAGRVRASLDRGRRVFAGIVGDEEE